MIGEGVSVGVGDDSGEGVGVGRDAVECLENGFVWLREARVGLREVGVTAMLVFCVGWDRKGWWVEILEYVLGS